MTIFDVQNKILRRAGVKNGGISIRWLDRASLIPPTLRRLKPRFKDRIPGRNDRREVVVSSAWIQKKQPAWWAVIVTTRLLGLPGAVTFETKEKS